MQFWQSKQVALAVKVLCCQYTAKCADQLEASSTGGAPVITAKCKCLLFGADTHPQLSLAHTAAHVCCNWMDSTSPCRSLQPEAEGHNSLYALVVGYCDTPYCCELVILGSTKHTAMLPWKADGHRSTFLLNTAFVILTASSSAQH